MKVNASVFAAAEIDAAGAAVAVAPDEKEALDTIERWRASHVLPMNFFYRSLSGRSKQRALNATIAQRIKRLPSIIDKLKRLPHLRLSRLQDIGGVRGIFFDIRDVEALQRSYADTPQRFGHQLIKVSDYVNAPRVSGYRAIHNVWEYRSKSRSDLNGLRVEVQLRTALQHTWATSVEIAGFLTGQNLKAGEGDPRWLRFFALLGTGLAFQEGSAPVPGTPTNVGEKRAQLIALETQC